MKTDERRRADALERYFDDLIADAGTPAPDELDPATARIARAVVATERGAERAAQGQEVRARVWGRALAGARTEPKRRRASPWPRPRWGASPLRMAGAAVMALLVLGGALWASPDARAQAERLACLVPGLGIRSCDAAELVATERVSASREGATLTVTSVFSSGDATTVRLEINGLSFPSGVPSLHEVRWTVRDDRGKTYVRPGVVMSGLSRSSASEGAPVYAMEGRFGALDPGVRAVDLAIEAPAPVGSWQMRVPVVPVGQAKLPPVREGTGGVTVQGITVRVAGVAADRRGLAVQVAAQSAAPGVIIRKVGGERGNRLLILRDANGREWTQLWPSNSAARREGGPHTDDALFPAGAADAQPATLIVPFVTVEEAGATATLRVPIAGKKAGDRIPLDADLTLGRERFRVTAAEFARDNKGEPRLWLSLNLGDWAAGRRLVDPGQSGRIEVNGDNTVWRGASDCGGEVGQCARIAVAIPRGAGGEVTVTFRDPLVAIRGPWELEVPLPERR